MFITALLGVVLANSDPWVLVSQNETITTVQQSVSTQTNLTLASVPVASYTWSAWMSQVVTGSDDETPSWASWLTPLTNASDGLAYSGSGPTKFTIIPAQYGFSAVKTYKSDIGYQRFENSTSGVERSRNWKTWMGVIETEASLVATDPPTDPGSPTSD